jgi:chromate reductase
METTPATRPLQVLGIAGSLRRASYNRQLLESARRLAPPALVITPFDIGEVPLYNADHDADAARPEAVRRLKQAIAVSDAVLFAAPEYNHGVPGVLQNVIDWASRPAFASPLAAKPVGMMGTSGGISGTMRGQQALKLVLMSTLALIFPHAGIAITLAKDKFDAGGMLAHEQTRELLAVYLADFERWVRRQAALPR